MDQADATDFEAVLKRIRVQAAEENIRITQHAQREMVEEDITLGEVLEVIATGHILENYPTHRRGSCCLLNGLTHSGRPTHVVCTTARSALIIATAYEPKPPKWVTPTRRRQAR